MSGAAIIRAEGLTKRYGSTEALTGLSFEVPEGEVFGFIGANGAGKTTTLRILAGLSRPDAGWARVDGLDVVDDLPRLHGLIGYMPDFFGVYDSMTAAEYLTFYASCHQVPKHLTPRVVNDLLELVALAPKRDAQVDSLSRGMKQRLCLARALVHDPKVLLLDEPASGLDPRARTEMRELVSVLQEMGKTIVLSSHILPELAEMCSSYGVIHDGRMFASGPARSHLGRGRAAAGPRSGRRRPRGSGKNGRRGTRCAERAAGGCKRTRYRVRRSWQRGWRHRRRFSPQGTGDSRPPCYGLPHGRRRARAAVPAAHRAPKGHASDCLRPGGAGPMTALPAEVGDRVSVGKNSPPQRAKAFLTAVTWNPIVAKELRTRMRGWHAFALLTAYTCVIGTLGWLVYNSDISSSGGAIGLSATGADVFRVLAAAVMATVALIVPGLVGPAISGERERQTLDLLLVTPLRSSTIVVGKLLAALYFVVFLVVACVPLFSVAFLLGGVSLAEVVEAVIFTLLGAFTFGAISMLASVSVRQVGASTVVSYLAMLVLAVGPVAGGYALNTAFNQPAQNGPAPFAVAQASTTSGIVDALSPAVGAASLLDASDCGVVTPFFGSGIAVPVSMVCGPGGAVRVRSRAVRDLADLGGRPGPRRRPCDGGSGRKRLGAGQAEDRVTPLSGSGYRGPGATRARGEATGDAGPGDGRGTGPGDGPGVGRARAPSVLSVGSKPVAIRRCDADERAGRGARAPAPACLRGLGGPFCPAGSGLVGRRRLLVVGLVQGPPDRQCRFYRRLPRCGCSPRGLYGLGGPTTRHRGGGSTGRRPSRPGRALGQRSLLCGRPGRHGSSTAGRRRESSVAPQTRRSVPARPAPETGHHGDRGRACSSSLSL